MKSNRDDQQKKQVSDQKTLTIGWPNLNPVHRQQLEKLANKESDAPRWFKDPAVKTNT